MNIKKIGSGSSWEAKVGYSRAIRYGNVIEVAGTTASDGVEVFFKGDAFHQTVYIFQLIESALIELGSSLNDVIRTRIYVKKINDFEEIGKAHAKFFSEVKPVATLVEVSNFVHEDLLVEIEITAVVQ